MHRSISKVICCIFMLLTCSACAYQGAVDSSFYRPNELSAPGKIPVAVVVVSSGKINNFNFPGGWSGATEIETKDAVIKSTHTAMSCIFENVDAAGNTKPLYKIEPSLQIRHDHPYLPQYTARLILNVFTYDTDEYVCQYADDQTFIIREAGASLALACITGLTLFTVAPITIPVSIKLDGEKAEHTLETALTRSLDGISSDIIRDKQKFASTTAMKTPMLTSQATVSKYDDYLNSVVVIRSSDGQGTGFIVTTKNYILTNSHVVGKDQEVSIRFRNGRTVLGKVMKIDAGRDLALIDFRGHGNPWLSLSTTSGGIGDDVLAIGAPFDLGWSVSKGIISAIRKLPNGVTVIQTDTAINPGNSGGPLVDLPSGQVIGVNSFGVDKNRAEGLNFAVTSSEVLRAFPELTE